MEPNHSLNPPNYNLASVVVHHGSGYFLNILFSIFSIENNESIIIKISFINNSSSDSGHYTSFTYHKQLRQWLHFNDSKVTIVQEEDLQKIQPYLLFYEAK